MGITHEHMSGTEADGIDDKRRNILKLTLGGAAAFATPLIASFSVEGLQAATLFCELGAPHFDDDAMTAVDDAGNLVVTVSLENLQECFADVTAVTATADAEVIYGCRTRDGRFPPPLERGQTVQDTVSATIDDDIPDTGSFEAILTLHPPAAPLRLCPPGLTPAVSKVTYRNIAVIVHLGGFETSQELDRVLTRTF